MAKYPDDKTFTITCTMRERWWPHFLGMLAEMGRLGRIGSSRDVTFFADGDGDFRPRFILPEIVMAEPAERKPGGDTYWDAG